MTFFFGFLSWKFISSLNLMAQSSQDRKSIIRGDVTNPKLKGVSAPKSQMVCPFYYLFISVLVNISSELIFFFIMPHNYLIFNWIWLKISSWWTTKISILSQTEAWLNERQSYLQRIRLLSNNPRVIWISS